MNKAEYKKACNDYDNLGARLEDAIEDKKENEVADLKKQMETLENQIHEYEHSTTK